MARESHLATSVRVALDKLHRARERSIRIGDPALVSPDDGVLLHGAIVSAIDEMTEALACERSAIHSQAEVIERVCRLTSAVNKHLLLEGWSSDCFCGEGDLKISRRQWRNNGNAIAFIEQATRQAMEVAKVKARGRQVRGLVDSARSAAQDFNRQIRADLRSIRKDHRLP